MYGQKFNPYAQFPTKGSQVYQNQYQEEDSEPLVEEIDQNYEPTDREVREYAVETLGMVFPEDEGLMYLAREGLKAQLPPNWVPYQGRDGEVYYEHRITQQKTYEHPTDIEYRKKYQQQKQKMARKNLKSMNMKGNNQLGMSANSNLYGSNASNMFGSKMSSSGFMGVPNNVMAVTSEPVSTINLDPKIQEELEEELNLFEERLKKEWKEFQGEEREKNETRMKKSKQDYERDFDRMLKEKIGETRVEDKLRSEKEKLKQKLQESIVAGYQQQIRQFEKGLESKISEFVAVYEQDNQIKTNRYQSEKDHQFSQREARYQQNVGKAGRLKERKKKEREQMLARLKIQLQQSQNHQIEKATVQALEQELASIRQSFAMKIRERESELQREYSQTRRVLGFDQSSYLSELAAKKARMKGISSLKVESFKKKEIQAINTRCQNELEEISDQLKEKLNVEYTKKLAQERKRQEQRVEKEKERLDQQTKHRTEAQIENIYSELKLKVKGYQAEMNKKLSTLNQKFITDLYDKSKGQNKDITVRLQLKEREMTFENKTQMIGSIKRQKELEQITYHLLKVQNELSKCGSAEEVEVKLAQLAKRFELDYRTEEFLRFQGQYKEMKGKYRRDKEFLASLMNSLQSHHRGSGVGAATVLRQYNQDVRVMRENDEILRKFEMLLRKAEINDKAAIAELSKGELQYQQVELNREMVKPHQLPVGLTQLGEQNVTRSEMMGGKDIECALREHSKFLTTMRHELNRKLYQLRSTYY